MLEVQQKTRHNKCFYKTCGSADVRMSIAKKEKKIGGLPTGVEPMTFEMLVECFESLRCGGLMLSKCNEIQVPRCYRLINKVRS